MVRLEQVAEVLKGKRFAVIGFNNEEAAEIGAAIGATGAYTHVVIENPTHPGLNSLAPFDACIINVSTEASDGDRRSVDLVADTRKPAILIGNGDDLLRCALSFASPRLEFIIKPWLAEEIQMRAFKVLRYAEESATDEKFSVPERPSVVVADDDRTTVTLLSSMLKTLGMPCYVASDGSEALVLTRKMRPALVLLDVSMPGMNGFEVLAALRQDPATRSIPVAMLTAAHAEGDVVRGFSLGADEYITKPFQPQEMLARLKRLLPRR